MLHLCGVVASGAYVMSFNLCGGAKRCRQEPTVVQLEPVLVIAATAAVVAAGLAHTVRVGAWMSQHSRAQSAVVWRADARHG